MRFVMRPVIPHSKRIEVYVLHAISKSGHDAKLYRSHYGSSRVAVPPSCLPAIVDTINSAFNTQIEPIDIAGKSALAIAGHVQALIGKSQREVVLT